MPEPESRGKAPFQEAQDRQASSPEGTAGPPAKASAQEGGGRCMGALRGCRQRLPTGGWCEPRTHEPGRGSTPTLPEAPWGCWLPGLGNAGPC